MLRISKAAERLGVHVQTLRKWERQGKITSHRLASGQRRYTAEELDGIAETKDGIVETKDERQSFIYCRVSSSKQKDDLDRQIAYMRDIYPDWEVISDIGSGTHYCRTGFRRLLDLVLRRMVTAIAVAHKDRLGRFGLDLFEHLCSSHGTAIIVDENRTMSPQAELVEDVIALITSFAARVHGLRRYIPRARDIAKAKDTNETSDGEDNLDVDKNGTKDL